MPLLGLRFAQKQCNSKLFLESKTNKISIIRLNYLEQKATTIHFRSWDISKRNIAFVFLLCGCRVVFWKTNISETYSKWNIVNED